MVLHDPMGKGSLSQWTRVNLKSNRTDPCAGLCDVRQVPTLFYAGSVLTLMARPDFLQYPAYFTYPTSLVQCALRMNKIPFSLTKV